MENEIIAYLLFVERIEERPYFAVSPEATRFLKKSPWELLAIWRKFNGESANE